MAKTYYTYIMTNKSGTLYTGVANDIFRRVWEHKTGKGSAFTGKYKITRLIYYEEYGDIREAILREKQIKGWVRVKKITLIETENPKWEDLSRDWFEVDPVKGDPSLRSG